MLFHAQATLTSSSDLCTDLHCAGEDDAAFFVMLRVEGNILSPCGGVKHTDTQTQRDTHTHAHVHTLTHFFRNDETGRVVLFFLALFSFFFPYAY